MLQVWTHARTGSDSTPYYFLKEPRKGKDLKGSLQQPLNSGLQLSSNLGYPWLSLSQSRTILKGALVSKVFEIATITGVHGHGHRTMSMWKTLSGVKKILSGDFKLSKFYNFFSFLKFKCGVLVEGIGETNVDFKLSKFFQTYELWVWHLAWLRACNVNMKVKVLKNFFSFMNFLCGNWLGWDRVT